MTTPKSILLLVALLLALPCSPAHATWYNENIEDGADIIMMDLRWPWWPPGTYYANWNTGFNPKPNNLSFYAGIQARMPDGAEALPNADASLQRAHRPGNTWSLWGYTAHGVPPRFIDVGPTLSIINAYGGEGTSAFLAAIPGRSSRTIAGIRCSAGCGGRRLETRKTSYAIRYEGLLRVPADGLYILRARIDGAYPRLCLTTAGDHWMSMRPLTEEPR